MITAYSITTLVVFFCSTLFVIHPVSIPVFARKRAPLNLTTAPIIAIAVLWAAQCLGPSQIRDGIVGTDGVKPYNILILFFSLAYMAISLDLTGILQAAAFWVSNKGGSNGWRLYLYLYLMLSVLSIILGNDPVILSGTAFLVYYTKVSELNPTPWLISEFAAANTASMVLFLGNPTNVVICEGFQVNNAAFTAYTILPFLACNLACFVALALQFRNPKHVPKGLNNTADLDVRSVLLDPHGAWVGGVLLGSCLVVIIVASFFKVDVWMISLPFAVAKFLYDMAWDHYRFDPQSTRSRSTTVKEVGLQQLKRRTSAGPQVPVTPLPAASISAPLRKSRKRSKLAAHYPTLFTALPRLPFALVPFAFSQFILIEGLAHQGWIDVFASWLRHATHRNPSDPNATICIIGLLGVILCNLSGTNIGATILLTKVIRASSLPPHTQRAAAISLAVASNIGAVSFTFSASLAGLLWREILRQKGIMISQRTFAYWNMLPVVLMSAVGLGVVCAEMAVV